MTPAPDDLTLLIVDDDPEMRAMLRDVLASAGFRIQEAASTDQLLALVPRVEPAAIIFDHDMPSQRGLEILPRLRKRYPGIPVIFIAAFGGPRTREAAERLGATAYLDKPFRVSHLLKVVHYLLSPAVRP